MAVERAIPVLIQVCGALQEAHEMGIVHRDLKPENIFLSLQGGLKDFPKVLDFGLAKVTERQMRPGSIILTQEGMVFGTPEFMSPEQAQGKTLDARSDIYSLADHSLRGADGQAAVRREDADGVHPEARAWNRRFRSTSACPARPSLLALGRSSRRALEKKPEDRYQSASEFAQALAPFGEPGVEHAIPSASRAVQPEAAPVIDRVAHTLRAPARRAGPGAGLLIGVAAACLALGVLLAVVAMKLFVK